MGKGTRPTEYRLNFLGRSPNDNDTNATVNISCVRSSAACDFEMERWIAAIF